MCLKILQVPEKGSWVRPSQELAKKNQIDVHPRRVHPDGTASRLPICAYFSCFLLCP